MNGGAGLERERAFIKADIVALHSGYAKIDEKKVDTLLGVAGYLEDTNLVGADVATKHKGERWPYQGTDYEMIRNLLRTIKPEKGQVFYDLGSGHGRIPLYGALVSEAKFVGIELVQERVEACNKSKEKLGLQNVEFRAGNIINQDISDGDVFYLFSPFTPKTASQVILKLKQVASNKQIKIVCLGAIEQLFENQDWLRSAGKISGFGTARIFESV